MEQNTLISQLKQSLSKQSISCQAHGQKITMICVDKECAEQTVEKNHQFLNPMCAKCVDQIRHLKRDHQQKDIQQVLVDFVAALLKNQGIPDRVKAQFQEIVQFLEILTSAVLNDRVFARVSGILSELSGEQQQQQQQQQSSDLLERIIGYMREFEISQDQKEMVLQLKETKYQLKSLQHLSNTNNNSSNGLKSNQTNDDCSVDSSDIPNHSEQQLASLLLNDFVQLLDIFQANHKQLDQNIITPLKSYRLLNSLNESPLDSTEKARLFKDAFRLETAGSNGDLRRGSGGSRRQSLEMFSADKKIMLLVNENDRLNFSLSAKIDEIDNIKMRLQKAEEDLKKTKTKNSNCFEEDNPQVGILTAEVERLNKALEFKDKEIENLYRRNSSKIEENGEVIIELQAQIDMLVKENERLNAVIAAKDDEIGSMESASHLEDKSADGLKSEIVRLNKLLAEQTINQGHFENEHAKIVEFKNNEIAGLKLKEIQLTEKYIALGKQIESLSQEVGRQNQEISAKSAEIDMWKNKIPQVNQKQQSDSDSKQLTVSQNQKLLLKHPNSALVVVEKPVNHGNHSVQTETSSDQKNKSSQILQTSSNTNPFPAYSDSKIGKNPSNLKTISTMEKFDFYKKAAENKLQQHQQQPSQSSQTSSAQQSPQQYLNVQIWQQPQPSSQTPSSFSNRFKSASTTLQSGADSNHNSSNTHNYSTNYIKFPQSSTKSQQNLESEHQHPYQQISPAFIRNSTAPQQQPYSLYTSTEQPSSVLSQNIQKVFKTLDSSSNLSQLNNQRIALDTKVQSLQSLSKEIGKLNTILGPRESIDKKKNTDKKLNSPSSSSAFIKSTSYRSGSEGIKQNTTSSSSSKHSNYNQNKNNYINHPN